VTVAGNGLMSIKRRKGRDSIRFVNATADGHLRVIDVSVPQIGAPIAWQAGYDGTGVTVGLLDSGADATHPDLFGLQDLRVEVSFDGGATWRPARMTGHTAKLTHPSGTGFVSLRATATDNRGNTVEQTIINAYRFA
jgi:subtilisin family serine protease